MKDSYLAKQMPESGLLTPNILNFQETCKAQETGTMPTAGD